MAWTQRLFVLVVVLLTQACTHWVVVRTSPPGARAKINGEYVGDTPLFYEETTGWSKTYRLELEKEGYEPRLEKLEQDDLMWKYACPAVCFCPFTLGLSLTGCLFSYGLADEYNFVLVPQDDSARPSGLGLGGSDGDKDGSSGKLPKEGPESQPGDVPKKDEKDGKDNGVVPF